MTNEDRLPHKQLWISIWFNSLLTDRELNRSATFILLSYHISEILTGHIVGMLQEDFEPQMEPTPAESTYCAGSGASFPSTSPSALCYCGRTFHRRVDCRQKTWSIRKHQPKGNLTSRAKISWEVYEHWKRYDTEQDYLMLFVPKDSTYDDLIKYGVV